MPVYNGEKYLKEAVNSILTQTMTNFEFIIIDDGSTDGSLRVLQNFQKQDPRIHLITRENKGFSNSVNEIVDLARGQWLARMDQDDIALPQRFERQLQWIKETDADICGSWVQLFGSKDKRILKHAQSNAAIKQELLFGTAFAHPSVIMRTKTIRTLRYDPAWDKAEDYELWARASLAGYNLTNIPEVLLMYRQHDSQISSATSVLQQQLTQKVRKIYWSKLPLPIKLSDRELNMVLSLRDPSILNIDMDRVSLVFSKLLDVCQDESIDITFDHITRLYFRAAPYNFFAPFHWFFLNKKYGQGYGVKTFASLLILSIFKINPNGNFYKILKRNFMAFMKIK